MTKELPSIKQSDIWCSCYVGMQVDYTGPIIFSVDCPLQDVMGNSLVVPLKALSFNVQGYVPMTATAYMSSE